MQNTILNHPLLLLATQIVCWCLAEHQLFLWWRLGKVGMIKARRECKKSEHAVKVFCLIAGSFASVHPVAAAQGKYKCCFQREGEKKKGVLLEGEWELSFTTLWRFYLEPFFFLISSSRANHVELITQTCEKWSFTKVSKSKEGKINHKLSSNLL